MRPRSYRTYGIAIVAVVLVAMAGCSGPFQTGDASTENDSTVTATETAVDANVTEATETDDDGESSAAADLESTGASGRMLFVVDGSDTHVDPATTNESGGVWINETESHRWHVENDSTTLAAALSAFGVEATADSLTYENETYDESTNGTNVAYRVDGAVVEDPAEYELEDGDEVFVTVYTANKSVPGREYSSSHPHAHGTLEATVNGEPVNFSRDRYEMNDDYFHFHGDENGSRWHAHSTNLTVSYALSSFDDFDASNGSVTVNGTTYDEDETSITVNGESVDPEQYVLKDGDQIELVVADTG